MQANVLLLGFTIGLDYRGQGIDIHSQHLDVENHLTVFGQYRLLDGDCRQCIPDGASVFGNVVFDAYAL